MNTSVIVIFLIGQFIIQAVLYYTLVRLVINKPISKILPNEMLHKVLPGLMIIENLGISAIVMIFTSAGAAAGMTNLMASVLLGVLMSIDCKVLLGSKKAKEQNEQQILKDLYFID